MTRNNRFGHSIIAAMVLLTLQGCGEGSSSSAGAGFGQGSNNGGSDNGGNTSGDYSNAELLQSLTDNVIVPTYQSFQSQTASQMASVNDYCAALINDVATASSQQQSAQADWKAMADVWQQAELMQIGPLTDNAYALRNSIYSWSVVSTCGVDQDVVYFQQGNINGATYQLNQRTDNRRGIDALEHLLFSQNLDHSCSGNVGPLADWNIRSNNERMLARCQFAAAVAADLQINATTLVDAWTGDNGYSAVLKAAGESGSDYATALKGINAVSDSMFYLDSVTKDAKIGKPLGKLEDGNSCIETICPQDAESIQSGYSVKNILANVLGFSKLFYGSESGQADEQSVGFDDFLTASGDEQTAQRIGQALEQMNTLANELDQPIDQLLVQDPAKVEALHGSLKVVTDEMKTNFITSLALELPTTSAGDND